MRSHDSHIIQYGADLNGSDRFGETALLTAVHENAHETITQLFNAGVDYTRRTTGGSTILHWAANEADLQTLQLLTRARMKGVDVEAKNVDGNTAAELAANRHGFNEAFQASFEKLVKSVWNVLDDDGDAGSVKTETTGGESWKSFEDAVWYEAEWAAKVDIRDGETSHGGTEIGRAVHGRPSKSSKPG